MTIYRTTLRKPDGLFYRERPNTHRYGTSVGAGVVDIVTLDDECVEKIREVAYPVVNADGTITVDFEVGPDGIEDEYALGLAVKELEDELNAFEYFQTPLHIERPEATTTKES